MRRASRWVVAALAMGLGAVLACSPVGATAPQEQPGVRSQAVGTPPESRAACASRAPCTMLLIAAGRTHTINLRAGGVVMETGRLGSVVARRTPASIAGLSGTTTAVAAGDGFSVALVGGVPWTWGEAADERLGRTAMGLAGTPGAVVDVSLQPLTGGFVAVAAGDAHGVALKGDGTVWVWGANDTRQRGTVGAPQAFAEAVAGVAQVIAVAAGGGHTLALEEDGSVWTWGLNDAYQLGQGTPSGYTLAPGQAQALSDVVAVAAGGKHSLALDAAGQVWAWGSNAKGQLAKVVSTPNASEPIRVSRWTDVVAIAAGAEHSVALRSDGTVWAWGSNARGQLGDEETFGAWRAEPMQVQGVGRVVAIAAGGAHTVAMRSDGAIIVWGENIDGQLGLGDELFVYEPHVVLGNVVAIAAGDKHSLAVLADGRLLAWGANDEGQLGVDGGVPLPAPTEVPGVTDVSAVAACGSRSVAVTKSGAVYAWGDNTSDGGVGMLGIAGVPEVVRAPTLVTGLQDVVQVSCSDTHMLAVTDTSGAVFAWGSNDWGQLGSGGTMPSVQPVQLTDLSNVREVAAGEGYSLARTAAGEVYSWGDGASGQLADGDAGPHTRESPAQTDMGPVSRISAGALTAAAVTSGDTLVTWGAGDGGLLGIANAPLVQADPTQLSFTGVGLVAMGRRHALLYRTASNSRLMAWGDNESGQLGRGSGPGRTTASSVPVPVLLVGSTPFTALAVGERHSLALLNDGTLLAWGSTVDGQLGLGTSSVQLQPTSRGDSYGVSGCDAPPTCQSGACVASECSNHGTCPLNACICDAGFIGSRCEYSDAETCNGHGEVHDDGTCACAPGFAGAGCNGCAAGHEGYPNCTPVQPNEDAGTGDAGSGFDAGVPGGDGGSPDVDGGVVTDDGGVVTDDGGRPTDGGVPVDGGGVGPRGALEFAAVGCSCGEVGGLQAFAVLALALLRRRRRRPTGA